MSELIFVMRKQFSNKSEDYRFIDKTTLMDFLKSPSHIIGDYQYGYINPEDDTLHIHKLDTETLRVMLY